MGEIRAINGVIVVSISTLAHEFGMARATVSKRISSSGLIPFEEVNGYPVYRMRDAAKAILGIPITSNGVDGNGDPDPEKLPPNERRAWMQSENERLKMLVTKKQLIPAEVHESEMAGVVKLAVQLLATLPDRLERECGLQTDAVDRLVMACDQARADFHGSLLAADPS